MEVFDVSKSAEKEEETESVKDDLEVTNILKTNDKTDSIDSSTTSSSDTGESNSHKIRHRMRPRPHFKQTGAGGQQRSSGRKLSTPGGSATTNYSMTCLERLIRTHPIWFLPKLNRDEASEFLTGKGSGAFIVRQSSQNNTLALSVRHSESQEESIEHYLIQQSTECPGKLNLESSDHLFDNVLSLVYHYSTTKDELPSTLLLPASLRESNSRQNLSAVALLGKDFWKYPMSENSTSEKKEKTGASGAAASRGSPSPISRLHRRKLSEPINNNNNNNQSHEAATATLEETLNGLQKVSDMLQASLKDLEGDETERPEQSQLISPPVPPPRVSSSPRCLRKETEEKVERVESTISVENMDAAEMLRSNQPIVQLRSKLSEEMFGSLESSDSTQQWYSYYRSSIADKISDYEDIWEPKSERCLSPAESELQFKAYLANKLTQNNGFEDDLPSSYCSSDTTGPRSSSSTTGLSSLNESLESITSSISEESSTGFLETQNGQEDQTEVIYSDPLDALEKATDTRIYDCPEYGEDKVDQEEVIYEEAGKKLQQINVQVQSSPKRRKRATVSALDAPVIKIEEKVFQRRSHSYIQHPFSHQRDRKDSTKSPENKRLSAVVSKYFKPIAKQTWQMDSSSWEFLNQINQNQSENATTTTACSDQDDKYKANTANSDKSKLVDSGLDSTLSYTNKSDDKDSLYESELGTLDPQTDEKSQLVKSRERIKDYVSTQLTGEKWLFGKMITQFLECTSNVAALHIFNTLRNIRQFMNGMKNYLVRHGEGDLHDIINEERTKLNSDEFLNVDLLLEEAMHALVIGPLTSRLRDSLRQNLMEKKSNPSQEPLTSNSDDNSEIMKNEVAFVTQQTLNAFKDCFIQMKNSVSPLDKLAHMLTGLKVITNAVGEEKMSDLNAEKFCLLLAHIIKEQEMSDWIEVDLELLWNLLPQSVLRGLSNGEATYYLTLVSSAANINTKGYRHSTSSAQTVLIGPANTQILDPTENNSSSLKSSTSTASGTASSVLLTVYIPNSESSNIVTKNVPLRNDTAKVKDVCTLLAHMMAISNHADHALFSIVDGKETLLPDDAKPLLIVDEARLQGNNFCAFAYQRTDALGNVWPAQMGIDLSKP